ncbi:unnamed protein product [Arabidopsis thaliana]|uniref:Uncharacterized protein n=1 Tax=Arabidopsis thaliana TaxID=3702 RepID=Q9LJP3_ARATH|nr:unnamed protein product [Arabidopsis thaliana]
MGTRNEIQRRRTDTKRKEHRRRNLNLRFERSGRKQQENTSTSSGDCKGDYFAASQTTTSSKRSNQIRLSEEAAAKPEPVTSLPE